MKKTLFIALVAVAALSIVSCKNNNKKSQEPTQEEIQAQKQALADSVLAKIDAFAEEYLDATSKTFAIKKFELTDAERMVQPDYLLDPSVASTLVTKSQKINALAVYFMDNVVRGIYGMPQDDTKEAIARLAADVNHPVDLEYINSDASRSEKVRKTYQVCKERGELAYFWQFANASLTEVSYLIANNPELFFNRITEEQYKSYCNRWYEINSALEELAKYDDEISEVWKFRVETSIALSKEDRKVKWGTIEIAKQTYAANKDKIISRRNALLQ